MAHLQEFPSRNSGEGERWVAFQPTIFQDGTPNLRRASYRASADGGAGPGRQACVRQIHPLPPGCGPFIPLRGRQRRLRRPRATDDQQHTMPRKEIEVCCDEVLSASGNSGDIVMLRELGHLLIKFADPIPVKTILVRLKNCMKL